MVRTPNGADVHAAVEAFDRASPQQSGARPRPAPPARRQPAERRAARGFCPAAAGRRPRWIPARRSTDAVSAPGELRNAIDAYTSHAAYASYDEQRKGTLARGMLADIVILSNNIFESEPERCARPP